MRTVNKLIKDSRWLVLAAAAVVGCNGATEGAVGASDASTSLGTGADASGVTATGPSGDGSVVTTACTTDQDCASFLGTLSSPPSPAGCAEAYCDPLLSHCGLRPVDNDGDTYRTAACAVVGVPFAAGFDCNDNDPNLYPGHSEPCTTLTDGGVEGWGIGTPTGVCAAGAVSCKGDGTESACVGEVPACSAGQSCVAGQCTGVCTAGETSCSGSNGTPGTPANAVWTCSAIGTWVTGETCTNQTCLSGSGDGGTSTGACEGVCAPGQPNCGSVDGGSSSLLQACTSAGTWTAGAVTVGSCNVICEPGQTQCDGYQTETCSANGTWGAGVVVGGQCNACLPGATQCDGILQELCQSSGTWSQGTVVVNQCNAVCVPGATQCVDGTLTETCGASATWPTTGQVVLNSCGAVCNPGQTLCVPPEQETCNSYGTWNAGVVVGGACGACTVGETQCNDTYLETCESNGAWNAPGVLSSVCGAQCSPTSGATQTCSSGKTGCGGSEACLANGTWDTTCSPVNCTPFNVAPSAAWNQGNTLCGGGSSNNSYTFTCPAGAHPTGCVSQCVNGCCMPGSSGCDSSIAMSNATGTSATCTLHQGVSGCNSETMEAIGQCEY